MSNDLTTFSGKVIMLKVTEMKTEVSFLNDSGGTNASAWPEWTLETARLAFSSQATLKVESRGTSVIGSKIVSLKLDR